MAVRVTSGARYLTLGRCLFLLIACAALGEAIAQLMVRAGISRTLPVGSFSMDWAGWLTAAAFLVAFQMFSRPVDGAA